MNKRDLRKAVRSLRRRYPRMPVQDIDALARSLAPRVKAGGDYYLPYPEKVARVRVVEYGTGGRNLKRVPVNPVVVSEDGGEHVVSADNLFSDELAAAIRSAEMAREIEEDS